MSQWSITSLINSRTIEPIAVGLILWGVQFAITSLVKRRDIRSEELREYDLGILEDGKELRKDLMDLLEQERKQCQTQLDQLARQLEKANKRIAQLESQMNRHHPPEP